MLDQRTLERFMSALKQQISRFDDSIKKQRREHRDNIADRIELSKIIFQEMMEYFIEINTQNQYQQLREAQVVAGALMATRPTQQPEYPFLRTIIEPIQPAPEVKALEAPAPKVKKLERYKCEHTTSFQARLKIMEVLENRPMHITEMLTKMGAAINKKNIHNLSCRLSIMVKNGEIDRPHQGLFQLKKEAQQV